MDKKLRAQLENICYEMTDAMDPTGRNTEFYKGYFGKMNDKRFEEFMDKLCVDDNYLILHHIDYETNLSMENIERAATVRGIPLYEKLALPYISKNPEEPIITKEAVPVGYLPMKKMQQTQFKKNSTSIEIAKRNKFNQVSGHDKNGRSSDMENYALAALGSEVIMKEFMSARADDSVMKNEMYSRISKNGYVSLDSLTDEVENKEVLNLIDVYLISMGLKSDLITSDLLTLHTINKL